MKDSTAISRFVTKVAEQLPPTQANPHQSTPAGNFTIEYCVVTAVNATGATAGADLPNTCTITYKGSTQSGIPWIGLPPIIGQQAMVLIQPPITIVIGHLSSMITPQWISIGSGLGTTFSAGVSNLGAPWQVVQIRRTADIVEIRGLYVSANATPYTLFFLPVGYRPTVQQTFTCDASVGFGRVDVYPNGQVSQQDGSTVSYGSFGGGVRFSIL